jgi:hypothetical protein
MADISKTLNSILRNDSKLNSYKIALVRSINDVVLSFPDIKNGLRGVAIPLRVLAEFWLAYYWPFADDEQPILQGPRAFRDGVLRNDVAFRPELTALRSQWANLFSVSRPADGYFLMSEMRVPRKRLTYTNTLLDTYSRTIQTMTRAIEYPIRYAGQGGGQYTVFQPPQPLSALNDVVPLPSAQAKDKCVVIQSDLWDEFSRLSLWIEALCIHEWSLFTETVGTPRGKAYSLLTDRPDNRRPLTWERNEIEILMMEGKTFFCPWTNKKLSTEVYDIDHIIPIAVFPFNDLWNLVPTDPYFNSHVKRARIPSAEKLSQAAPHLVRAYKHYQDSLKLARVLQEDVSLRFRALSDGYAPADIAAAVLNLTESIATARNANRF